MALRPTLGRQQAHGLVERAAKARGGGRLSWAPSWPTRDRHRGARRRASWNGCSTRPPISAWRARSSTGRWRRHAGSLTRRRRGTTTSEGPRGRPRPGALQLARHGARDVGPAGARLRRRATACCATTAAATAARRCRPAPTRSSASAATRWRSWTRSGSSGSPSAASHRAAWSAMWLGANAPDRVERLVLVNTSARLGAPELWDRASRPSGPRAWGPSRRAYRALVHGSASARARRRLVAKVARRWRRPTPRATPPAARPSATSTCADALRGISAPTLVIAGHHDPPTPPEHARRSPTAIPGARMVAAGRRPPRQRRAARPTSPRPSSTSWPARRPDER